MMSQRCGHGGRKQGGAWWRASPGRHEAWPNQLESGLAARFQPLRYVHAPYVGTAGLDTDAANSDLSIIST